MTESHVDFTSFGFDEQDFSIEDYDDYPDGFCNLENENLFPISKFPMFRGNDTPSARNAYALILPALLLISRIILERWETYRVFTRRRQMGGVDMFLDADVELELSKDEVERCIKSVIPDIDFDPDMHSNSSSFARTTLIPKATSDLIVLDYNLVKLLKSATARHSQKLAGLVFLAIAIGHEMAHILEFRSIRGGLLRPNGEPFKTPPGITCREAGTAWETRAFGGRVHPICELENNLQQIRGLCVRSGAWDFEWMRVSDGWIRRLFTENHWTSEQHPLRPPISKYARYAVLEDDLVDKSPNTPTKCKGHEKDVIIQSSRPKRVRNRPVRTYSLCGGKEVWKDTPN